MTVVPQAWSRSLLTPVQATVQCDKEYGHFLGPVLDVVARETQYPGSAMKHLYSME